MSRSKGVLNWELPEPKRPHSDQHYPGEQRRHREPAVTLRRDDAGNNRHERTRRSADLHPTAAEGRDQKPTDNRGPKPLRRRDPRRDPKPDRERQSHDRDRDPREKVAKEGAPIIPSEIIEETQTHRSLF